MKKTFAILFAFIIILSAIAVPAFAAETYTLTIAQAAPGHVYDVYQIFVGDLVAGEQGSNPILSNITWGSAIVCDPDPDTTGEAGEYDYASALVAALKSDAEVLSYVSGGTTVETSLAQVFADVANDSGAAAAVAEVLGSGVPGVVVERFAQVVGEAVYADGVFQSHQHLGSAVGTAAYSEANGNYSISGLDAGYYLVKDREGSQNGTAGFHTEYILQVVQSVTVQVKGDTVSVTKKVSDALDGEFGKMVSVGSTDRIYYQWTGTLPENLASYTTYAYRFTDTLPQGIAFNRFESICILDEDGDVVFTLLDLNDDNTANDVLPQGISAVMPMALGDDQITLAFDNVRSCYENLSADHQVQVCYSAAVTAEAPAGTAMTGSVYLEYSNNPNGEGMGKTVEDFTHAFTFDLRVDKYETNNESKKLAGVTFYLYRIEEGAMQYAQVTGGAVSGWTADRTAATVLTTDAAGAINVTGLVAGTYYWEELSTLPGYNLLTAPVSVQISATYAGTDTLQATANVEYRVDNVPQGANAVVGIPNSQGSVLPSTGGMGTMLFYTLGGILAVCTVVVLITRKRLAE